MLAKTLPLVKKSPYGLFLFYSGYFERTERPVVPAIARPVPVEVGQTTIARVTPVDTVGTVLEIYLSPSISSGVE